MQGQHQDHLLQGQVAAAVGGMTTAVRQDQVVVVQEQKIMGRPLEMAQQTQVAAVVVPTEAQPQVEQVVQV